MRLADILETVEELNEGAINKKRMAMKGGNYLKRSTSILKKLKPKKGKINWDGDKKAFKAGISLGKALLSKNPLKEVKAILKDKANKPFVVAAADALLKAHAKTPKDSLDDKINYFVKKVVTSAGANKSNVMKALELIRPDLEALEGEEA